MLEKDHLVCIIGGASISGTIINALVNAGKLILELGRSLGSAIRRARLKKVCAV